MPPAFPLSFLNALPLYLNNFSHSCFQSILHCNKGYTFQIVYLLAALNAFFLFICVIRSLNMYLSTGGFNHHRDLFHFHVNDLFLFFFFVQRGKHTLNVESTLRVLQLSASLPCLTLLVRRYTHVTHSSC